jgi:hypothetical protein
MSDSPVSQALEALTLADIWELAPDASEAPRRDGLRESPFRQDKNPSFSIFGGLRRYKDQASDDKAGGVWTFVQACRPEWSKQEVARFLVERAGLQWKDSASEKKPSIWKYKAEQSKRNQAARAKIYRDVAPPIDRPGEVKPWPAFVHDHYMRPDPRDPDRCERLAKRRGWPLDWVDYLYNLGDLRFPTLPWNEKHFPAFIVADPRRTVTGYHQRIWTEADGPAWLFVPYAAKKASNAYTRALADYAGTATGRLVQPLPYYIGTMPAESSLWIICEGQWDAITIFGLLGGFDDQFSLPVTVFGLRGAEGGPAVFLSHYQDILRTRKPELWLLPDNDRAGSIWDGAGQPTVGAKPRRASFAARLRELVGQERHIPVSRVPARYGKDFNDYFKAASPSRESIMAQISKLFTTWTQQQAS